MTATKDSNLPTAAVGAPTPVIDLASSKASRDRYRLADAADWATLSRRLTLYAKKRIGSQGLVGDPEDLSQEAMRHFCEHMDTWDHVNVPLERHLASVLNGILVNLRRKGANRNPSGKDGAASRRPGEEPEDDHDITRRADSEDPHAPGAFKPAGAILAAPVDDPCAHDEEDALASREHAREIIRRTHAALADDPFALEVLAQFAGGTDMPKEQALALGRPLPDVLAARKRIHRKARQLRAQLEGSDES